ncbi:MAG TPA: HAD-IIA family hydrolase [Aeromicrobium sp.]|nr:HAD-IIA family hydrolase [Aeromicrobium sp.]
MSTVLKSSDVPLAGAFEAIFFDLDGVVYRGRAPVNGAVAAIGAISAGAFGFLTNNANRTPQAIAEHLKSLGIATTADAVVTSAQAIAGVIASDLPPGSPVFVVGGEGLRAAVRDVGLEPVSQRESSLAVAQGYSPDLGWRDLAEVSYAVQSGMPWYVSNLDLTIPTDAGIAPGNGSLVQAVATATGATPVVAGKPFAPLFDAAKSRFGVEAPLMVGDRLDTDIRGANQASLDSLMVLTGVNSLSDLLTASTVERPTFISADLAGLQHVHLPVTVEANKSRCGTAIAQIEGNTLHVSQAGKDSTQSLRALVTLGWQFVDETNEPLQLDARIDL